jgi:hypothetical protein
MRWWVAVGVVLAVLASIVTPDATAQTQSEDEVAEQTASDAPPEDHRADFGDAVARAPEGGSALESDSGGQMAGDSSVVDDIVGSVEVTPEEEVPAPLPATLDALLGEAELVAATDGPAEVVEVEELRTETSNTFTTGDGRLVTEISSQPRNVEEHGEWKPIDLSLQHVDAAALEPHGRVWT